MKKTDLLLTRKLKNKLTVFTKSSVQLLIMSHFLEKILLSEFDDSDSSTSPYRSLSSMSIEKNQKSDSVDWSSGQFAIEKLLNDSSIKQSSCDELLQNHYFFDELVSEGKPLSFFGSN